MGFTIKELETLSGIKAHTIRIWEQRYQFLKPSRTSTNIRTYSNDELKTLLTVALLNRHGYKISRIDDMAPDQRKQEALNIKDFSAQTENLVNELIGHMIDLDIAAFENVLQQQIQSKGLFETVTSLFFQFLEKTGILWQTGRINPAHEHIVSNIIRQKLVAAIEQLPQSKREAPLMLLLLPENEFHELGLLFVFYLLRQKGLPVIYLGANVPTPDAQYVVNIKHPQYLYIHLTSSGSRHQLQKFIASLSQNQQLKILVSGGSTEYLQKAKPANLTLLQSLSEVLAYIDKL